MDFTTKSLENTLSHTKTLALSLGNMKQKYQEKSKALKVCQEQKSTLTKELKDATRIIETTKNLVENLERTNEKLTNALKEAAVNLSELEQDSLQKQDTIDSLKVESSEFENAMEEWRKEREANVRQDKERQAALSVFLSEQKALLSEVEVNEREKENLKNLLSELNEEKEELANELIRYKEQLQNTSAAMDRQMVDDEEILDALRKEVEETEAKRIEDVGRLAEELAKEREEKSKAEDYLIKLKEVVKSLEIQLELHIAEKSILEREAREKQSIQMSFENCKKEKALLLDRIAVRKDYQFLEKEVIKISHDKEKTAEKAESLWSMSQQIISNFETVAWNYKEQNESLQLREINRLLNKKLDELQHEFSKSADLIDDLKEKNIDLHRRNEEISKLAEDDKVSLEKRALLLEKQLTEIGSDLINSRQNEERYYRKFIEEVQFRKHQEDEAHNLKECMDKSLKDQQKLKKMLDRKVTKLMEIDLMMDSLRK